MKKLLTSLLLLTVFAMPAVARVVPTIKTIPNQTICEPLGSPCYGERFFFDPNDWTFITPQNSYIMRDPRFPQTKLPHLFWRAYALNGEFVTIFVYTDEQGVPEEVTRFTIYQAATGAPNDKIVNLEWSFTGLSGSWHLVTTEEFTRGEDNRSAVYTQDGSSIPYTDFYVTIEALPGNNGRLHIRDADTGVDGLDLVGVVAETTNDAPVPSLNFTLVEPGVLRVFDPDDQILYLGFSNPLPECGKYFFRGVLKQVRDDSLDGLGQIPGPIPKEDKVIIVSKFLVRGDECAHMNRYQ